MPVLRTMGEVGSVPAGDPDPAADAEAVSGVGEKLSSTLRAVEQDELDLGQIKRYDQAGHSSAAPQVAPALTRCWIGCVAVCTRVPKMRLEIPGSEETPSLTALEHLQKPFIVSAHGRNSR